MRQLRLVLADASFRFSTQGDVTYDQRVLLGAWRVEASNAELDREHLTVGSPRIELPANRLGGRRAGNPPQPREQVGRRIDELVNVVSDQQVARKLEQPFDRRIDRLDLPVRIDCQDAVPRRIQDRRSTPFARSKGEGQAVPLADYRPEHQASRSQCEHQKLKGAKRNLPLVANLQPGD